MGEEKTRELVAEHDAWILRDAQARLASYPVKYSLEALEGDPAGVIVRRRF